MGDTNLPNIDWKSNAIIGHQNLHSLNKHFLDFLADYCFTLVTFPTRQKPDLVFVCQPILGISDHDFMKVHSDDES